MTDLDGQQQEPGAAAASNGDSSADSTAAMAPEEEEDQPETFQTSVSRTSTSTTSSDHQNRSSKDGKEQQQSPSSTTCCLRTSILKISAEKKARKVKFYRNGDRFFKGLVLAVTWDKYRTFESLLADLTRALVDGRSLPSGVRSVVTLDGRRIATLDELEESQSYVCCGTEAYKKMDYGKAEAPHWRTRSVGPNSGGLSIPGTPEAISESASVGPRDFIRPKLITVIRNGIRPRKAVRLLLNRKTAHSFEQVLADVTEAIKLDTGAVRKVFTLDGRPVITLQDFFRDEDIFLAYGPEKYSHDDFDLDSDECKSIQPYSKSPMSGRKYYRISIGSPRATRRRLVSPGSQTNGETSFTAPKSPKKSRPKMPTKSKQNLQNGHSVSPSTTEVPHKCPPQITNMYEVGRIIGDGNFAVVRECISRTNNNAYALKIIDKSKCRGKEQMIESEVAILRRVRHDNIVRLIEEYDSQDELYLVMELVKGGDLFDAIAAVTKFSERASSSMVQDLVSALQYLHNLNIVHRDIKPENLLVVDKPDGSKSLKLGDFGLAQVVTEPLYTVCGTPTYVAPEILAESGYSVKVDIWAAGVIMYILLCGFPPFVSPTNNQEELFDQILSGHYEFTSPYWDEISDSAKELINHMLQVDPDLRFSADEVLDHPWITDEDALDTDMHYKLTHKLGLHFTTPAPPHKSAGMTLIASTTLDRELHFFPAIHQQPYSKENRNREQMQPVFSIMGKEEHL